MGPCRSRSDPQSRKCKIINDSLKKSARINPLRLLLLGPGESGKSTIFKQMKIIQDRGGYNKEELVSYKMSIYYNCVSQMRIMLTVMESHNLPFSTVSAQEAAIKLLQLINDGIPWVPEMGPLIKILWADQSLRNSYDLGKLFHINDTANYFFNEIERISLENYIPTEKDVLCAKIRSTGIQEVVFTFEKLSFTLVDVGGQRSERRKWIHCFDNVTAVLYCAAISEYDQILREDGTQNRLNEALAVFKEISNSQNFARCSIILFLNKTDLFEMKFEKVPLTVWMPSFKGSSMEDAKEFIKQQFVKLTSHYIFPHYTCALDTENIKVVINAAREELLQGSMQMMGLSI